MPERLKGSTEIRSDFETIIFRDYTKLLNYVALNIKNKKKPFQSRQSQRTQRKFGKTNINRYFYIKKLKKNTSLDQ